MRKVLLRFLGEDDPAYFLNGKIYTAIARYEDNIHLRIIDESEEDYIYCLKNFEIVKGCIEDLPFDGLDCIVKGTPEGIKQDDIIVEKINKFKYL